MELRLAQIAEICHGRIVDGSGDLLVTGVAIDSRQVSQGDLFVPIVGERVDGHDYLLDVAAKGGVASFCDQERVSGVETGGLALIAVPSALSAFQELASWYRDQMKAQVVGVTGSVGKTSTKDLITSVLGRQFQVMANKGNLNTEIGLPLTLFDLEPEVEYAVLEMGMRGPGQIQHLAEIAKPLIGVITNVGESHIEILGSKEAIAQAKGELIRCLPQAGWAILNGDDPLVRGQARSTQAQVVYYGLSGAADLKVWADAVSQLADGRVKFRLHVAEEVEEVTLSIPGKHNVLNALAAAGVGHCVGLGIKQIAQGLSLAGLTGMRCEILHSLKGFTVINDTYNACFDSMRAGLDLLASLKKRESRSIAVLGDMLELGTNSQSAHERVGRYAASSGADLLITVGQRAVGIAQAAKEAGLEGNKVFALSTTKEATDFLKPIVGANDVLLIKGSRGMQMEKIVNALLEEEQNGD